MKKVIVKTPLGLKTFLYLDGALVYQEDANDLLEQLRERESRTDLLDLKSWGRKPMDSSQN